MTMTASCRSGRPALSAALALAISLPAASQPLPPARMPTDAEIAAAMAASRDQMPVLALPVGAGSQIDIQAIAAQAERATGLGAGGRPKDSASRSVDGLMIFVSLSMPRATLQALVEQAERAHAQLVLRGLKDRSIRKTAEAVRAVLGTRKVAWTIDPQAFERFAVAAVPTYVLVDPRQPVTMGCDGGQCGPMAFSKLTGDVSMDYALRTMEREDPPFSTLARRHLAAMRGTR
ncbi:type-F conjugative transfer system pilin assembly protein TrbC [Ideonella sp. 4Y11]|uniref:Type-F conjugative transfer system pilin assembly protein TrbC n=1 Tax=Ideonella aquatica TaxID=2824119 RepID=A0A941BN99_9BURK|nr:type-F conjugative transfer system pilin assembly protein TrbC [Ideonella aquatica]MBQ0961754.1 type-F conjugative transfer system pilin assembly protein TrbC [Ideonella aquatica]